jgi:hypothetical protein
MIYLIYLLFFHCVGGALIADSFSDFSGNQGYKGFYYKYNDEVNTLTMPNYGDSWIGGSMSWQLVDSWCQIGEGVMHTTTGGSIDDCNTPNGYCAPHLLWINSQPQDGNSFLLTASHTTPFSPGRDGVILSVYINGQFTESFVTPFTISKNYGPFSINNISLVLDPKDTCNNDGTNYRLEIYEPDPSPSPTKTPTQSPSPTASYTSSPSLSPSPTGVCHTIRSLLFGTQENVSGDGVVFTVLHGFNVTHNSPYERCGANPICTDLGHLCRCIYGGGTINSCSTQRSTTITYSLSTSNSLSYNGQSPSCAYHMSRSYNIPSATPTMSGTSSNTASITSSSSITPTPSQTPSPSATGICNEIKNYVDGNLEIIYDNSTRYNLFHGRYITTPYLQNFDMLIGIFNSCAENGDSCVCSYNSGYSVNCATARSAIVNFTLGSILQTSYYNQSNCAYVFNASYIRPSVTPTSSNTASITASWTPSPSRTETATGTQTSTGTQTQTGSGTNTQTSSQTSTQTGTPSSTATPSSTVTPTATQSGTATQTSTSTSTQTPTSSSTGTQTRTGTSTVTPTSTATGICNDVRNYVFGRRDTPTDVYTIFHGDRMTHFYYPGNNVLIGKLPMCNDYGDACVCIYGDGDPAFCPEKRIGIVSYSYDNDYRTFLVNDSDPVCVYKFNTTFFLPYLSPTPTRSRSPTPSPTFIPNFVSSGVTTLHLPPNFPSIPNNASNAILANIAERFVGSLGNISSVGRGPGNNDLIDALSVLASKLSAVSANITLSIAGEGFSWIMAPASATAPIKAGNISAVLPPLGPGLTYSFLAKTPDSNDSLPVFSIDALGSANDRYTITNLKTPLAFSLNITPQEGTILECVYWNGSSWATDGCAFINGTCICTHFTEFSARFKAIADVNADIFRGAKDVYSLEGFKKYGAIYGILIGLFLGISGIFCFLLHLDRRGERSYRFAIEDIEEVCKVLGYNKPLVPQPSITLPSPENNSCFSRFFSACISRLLYQHNYFGIFFKYDPRLPRGFRLLLVTTLAFHTLFLSVLFYGYTKVGPEMTLIESVVLSLITSALNIPFLRIVVGIVNKIGIYEYVVRFPDFAHEYNRRREFETALKNIHTHEISRIVRRLAEGKSALRAVQLSPVGPNKNRRGSIEYTDVSAYGGETTDAILGVLIERCFHCSRRNKNSKNGVLQAIEIARRSDPHFDIPACNNCPTKTAYGFIFSCAAFGYIGWIMNYLLLFTASQSSSSMNSIAASFGISQATSILFTQPLTLFLTLFGSWALDKIKSRRRTTKNQIGYFVDPLFMKNSSSLSGNWAYWLFLYGGSQSSLGFNSKEKSLGYSTLKVALEWVNGNNSVNISARDAAITTLYVYLRGIEKPLHGRAAAAAAAADQLKALLMEAPHSSIITVEKPNNEEVGEVNIILNEIVTHSKNGRSSIVPESARNGSTY